MKLSEWEGLGHEISQLVQEPHRACKGESPTGDLGFYCKSDGQHSEVLEQENDVI